MYYFIDEDTLTVTTRKHLYNAEALEGSISSIEPDTKCDIIVHVPTKKFVYEYYIKESVKAEEGYNMIEKLGTKNNVSKGNTYYALVPSDRLDDYVSINELEKRTNRFDSEGDKKNESKKINPDIKKISQSESNLTKQSSKFRKLISDYDGIKTVD